VGGTTGLEVWFDTSTGRARVRQVRVVPDTLLAQQDAERVRVTKELETPSTEGTTVF
jgi:hypothetical protein